MVFLLDMSCMFDEAREHSEQYKLSVAVYISHVYDLSIHVFSDCRQLQ